MSDSHTQSPFTVGAMVTNPDAFVGRRDAIDYIIRNMVKDQPVTLNIMGGRKSGKSSLLFHVVQTYETPGLFHS